MNYSALKDQACKRIGVSRSPAIGRFTHAGEACPQTRGRPTDSRAQIAQRPRAGCRHPHAATGKVLRRYAEKPLTHLWVPLGGAEHQHHLAPVSFGFPRLCRIAAIAAFSAEVSTGVPS